MGRGTLAQFTLLPSSAVATVTSMSEVSAKGHNGTVTFDGAFVTIRRTGFLARASVGRGEKRIPLASITAVQWKQPGALVNGFIAFTLGGGNEKQSKFGSQTTDAVHDENAVIVTKAQTAQFEALRLAVDTALRGHHAPHAPANVASGAEELARLAQLHQQGVLTDGEFSAAKARALGL